MTRFAGQTIIITGAASGLGAECARQFAAEGANLGLVDLDSARLEKTAKSLTSMTGEIFTVTGDVSQSETSRLAIDGVLGRFGRVDSLINNAGIDPLSATDVLNTSLADWDAVMSVNLRSAFLFTQAVLPTMRKQGRGSVVNVSSIAANLPSERETVYSVSKAGLQHLTRCTALDYATDGIRANCVCPGFMEAVMTDRAADLDDDDLARRSDLAARLVPLRREARYAEVARAVLFLASEDDAAYITGASIAIDGGLSLK
ncbi:MAG: SDR family NAD(P)-dependent oxidoreductase [Pseudomonadota bacterium]